MAFESSSPTIPKYAFTIQDSFLDLGCESRRTSRIKQGQKNRPTPTRHPRFTQHEGDNNISSPSPSKAPPTSSRTVYNAATPKRTNANPRLRYPSIPNASYDNCSLNDVPYYGKYYPLSVPPKQTSRDPAPLPDDNFFNSLSSVSKSTVSFSHSKDQFVFSSILKRLNPELVLENSGSVARDHLASERTFLAYVRTSIGLAAAGIGIVQLLTIADFTWESSGIPLSDMNKGLQRFTMPLGIMTLLFSLMILFLGVYRYFTIQNALPKNMFPVAKLSIAFISFVLGAFVVVAFGVLLNGRIGGL